MVPANIVKISTATTGNTITKIKPVLSMFELGGLELDFISCTEIRKKYLNFNFNPGLSKIFRPFSPFFFV